MVYKWEKESWLQMQEIRGEQHAGLFGASVDISASGMVIGAPGEFRENASKPTGAAYFFKYSAVSNNWTQIGPAIYGLADGSSGNESFGVSVAVSDSRRLVVGAPNHNQTGAVYTFQLFRGSASGISPFEWQALSNVPLSKGLPGDKLGSSVAISRDGYRILAGAPGGRGSKGYVLLYSWSVNTREWILEQFLTGSNAGAAFGSTVTMLSDSGNCFAVGSPGLQDNRGGIFIYYLNGTSQVEQLGQDILGSPDENLGLFGTLSGNQTPNGTNILAGTATGVVRRFDYIESENAWVEIFPPVNTSLAGGVTSLSATEDSKIFITGSSSSDAVEFFQAPGAQYPIMSSLLPPALALLPADSPTMQPTTMRSTSGPTETPTPSPTQSPTIIFQSSPPQSSPYKHADPNNHTWTAVVSFHGDHSLGDSVAMTDSFMAASDSTGYGLVNIYKVGNSHEWSPLYTVFGQQIDSLFGTSVDWNNGANASLVVGAPGMNALGTDTPTGAVYYYQPYDYGNIFTQLGSDIRGDNDVYSANEFFGYSVAVSANGVVAVGAPFSNKGNVLQRGRVYTFKYSASRGVWNPMQLPWLVGPESGDRLGMAVDVSADGSILMAGAIGHKNSSGAVFIYNWNGTEWTLISQIASSSPGEAFGSSVLVLSENGQYIAAGGPGYDGYAGVIRVYQRIIGTNHYELLGSITGNPGDSLGLGGSLAGTATPYPVILAATQSGWVKRFVFASGSPHGILVEANIATLKNVTTSPCLGLSLDGNSFVVGGSNEAIIYSTH